jgi:flavoprotein
MAGELEEIDLFVSKAASEVARMYRQDFKLSKTARVFRDTTASAAPVGLSYYGVYHLLIVAPAMPNTVAKCVFGIAGTLVTNVFTQAGKCRVPAVALACDAAPELDKSFASTTVVESLEQPEAVLARRWREQNG